MGLKGSDGLMVSGVGLSALLPRERCAMKRAAGGGFTLIEIILAGMTLAIALAALLGAFLGQLTLNEHARNLSLAVHDANRVIEQIRQDNMNCTMPNIDPRDLAGAPTSWNAWLQAQNPGKSIPNADRNAEEQIMVTCLRRNPSAPPLNPADYCGTGGTAQVGPGEWRVNGGTTTFDPLLLTVSVCWRHRGRVIGECAWNAGANRLDAADGGNGPNPNAGVIDSPASLMTLVTCRG